MIHDNDEWATPEDASPERIAAALKLIEGLSTNTLLPVTRETKLVILEGAAAIQTCRRLGIAIDKTIWGRK